MPTSRSVNQPLGLNHVLVCVADAGMRKKEAIPMAMVMRPSIRNNQRHPAMLWMPRMCSRPYAITEVTTMVR